MKSCTNCGAEAYRVESRYCHKCGAEINSHNDAASHQNLCTNPDCEWNKSKFIYPDDARFCDGCGSTTVYAK